MRWPGRALINAALLLALLHCSPPAHPPQKTPPAGNPNVTNPNSTPGNPNYKVPAEIAGHHVGMYYAVWQWEAWTYMNEARGMGLPQLSVEAVLRSRQPGGENYTFSQMQDPRIAGDSGGFYYQYDPADGFYCIYHQRSPGEVNYNAAFEGDYGAGQKPDCPMYKTVLARHAAQLTGMGVDFVFVDMTNPATYDRGSDAIQTRPFEVLTEEWQALRAQGVATPAVMAWQRLPQAPALPTDGQDYAVQHVLAVYNDPKHADVIMRDPASGKKIFLYVGSDNADPAWPTFVESNGGKNDIIAIPMWGPTDTQWCAAYVCQAGPMLDDSPCDQPMTPHSRLGSQSSVTPKYQSPFWASLPFNTVGVHNGLTLRKQFASALQQDPNWLLIYGWNEQIAQAWSTQGTVPSMGFESDGTIGDKGFIDLYGAEYTRDIEPSAQYGSMMYDLTQSCIGLYRRGLTSCSDPNELCCQGGNFSDGFAYINSANGLFELTRAAGAGRKPLYQCMQGTNPFYTFSASCDANTPATLLGQVFTERGGFGLRALTRCKNSDGVYYTTFTGSCGGDSLDAALGYVR